MTNIETTDLVKEFNNFAPPGVPQARMKGNHAYYASLLGVYRGRHAGMPSTADGTWIMAIDDEGAIHPMYVEPRVIVSPFKLKQAKD